MASKWGIEKPIRRERKKSKKKSKTIPIDDKAASIILKSFLESRKN
jgi:RNase H-fold protein (predicted Holliday junction resolvase)